MRPTTAKSANDRPAIQAVRRGFAECGVPRTPHSADAKSMLVQLGHEVLRTRNLRGRPSQH